MTEGEAKQKWCPMVRVGMPVGGSMNRDTQNHHESEAYRRYYNCIGSDCMMWRGAGETTEPTGEFEKYKDEKTGLYTSRPIYMVNKIGYCGLAGKP